MFCNKKENDDIAAAAGGHFVSLLLRAALAIALWATLEAHGVEEVRTHLTIPQINEIFGR